jgi:hypothetical protein
MTNSMLDEAVARIRGVADVHCENQVYVFSDYDYENYDATAVCERLGIPYSDDLYLCYPVKSTFDPLSESDIDAAERDLGATLPTDYKELLLQFGQFHLPGKEVICVEGPRQAAATTRACWTYEGALTVLAISSYHKTADGDSIGFLRNGNSFGNELYHFNHDLRENGDDPKQWSEKVANSLAEFIVSHLASKGLA